jgi:hypothetical protein
MRWVGRLIRATLLLAGSLWQVAFALLGVAVLTAAGLLLFHGDLVGGAVFVLVGGWWLAQTVAVSVWRRRHHTHVAAVKRLLTILRGMRMDSAYLNRDAGVVFFLSYGRGRYAVFRADEAHVAELSEAVEAGEPGLAFVETFTVMPGGSTVARDLLGFAFQATSGGDLAEVDSGRPRGRKALWARLQTATDGLLATSESEVRDLADQIVGAERLPQDDEEQG